MQPHLHRLNSLYGSNVCGEGGEYESLVLDCPVFRHGRIVIDDAEVGRALNRAARGGVGVKPVPAMSEEVTVCSFMTCLPRQCLTLCHVNQVVMVSSDPVAPVGYLSPTAFHVELKGNPEEDTFLRAAGDVREVPDDWTPTSHRCASQVGKNTSYKGYGWLGPRS